MSQQDFSSSAADRIASAEASLGKALAAIQRALAHIDEMGRAVDTQLQLRKAASAVDDAMNAHALATTGVIPSRSAAAPEVVAAIAAAIATVLTGPYRLVSVQKVAVPVSQHSPWVLEGRAQMLRSHSLR
jgi:hypothetical protein